MFSLIVAVTEDWGIGRQGNLPWHPKRIPSDMTFFKHLTCNVKEFKFESSQFVTGGDQENAVIMGRLTWESIPARFRPLPGRHNIVLSSKKSSNNEVMLKESLQEALDWCRINGIGTVYAIGGARVYEEALKHPGLKSAFVTKISGDFRSDVSFPREILFEHFAEHDITENVKALLKGLDPNIFLDEGIKFYIYKRK